MGKMSWNLSLAISIMLHGVLFFSLPAFFFHRNVVRQQKRELQIMPQELEKISEIDEDLIDLKKPPAYLEDIVKKTILDSTSPFSLEKPEMDTASNPIELIVEKVQPVIPPHQSEEALYSRDTQSQIQDTPAYMDYYRAVREKIRNVAHKHYSTTEKGVVNVSFIISKNGNLSTLDFSDSPSSNYNLIQVARRSVNDAAPFPSFPEELDYSQLQFNLSIHFKNN